jgi:DNA-binding transcriptional LysR family regulator
MPALPSTQGIADLLMLVDTGSYRMAGQQAGARPGELLSSVHALEKALGVSLLLADGQDRVKLTADGQRLLPHARKLLADAEQLGERFRRPDAMREIRVICSHYLASFLLIDRLRAFRLRHPQVQLKLSVRTEVQILSALQQDTGCGVGFCAPLEFPDGLHYRHWFAMNWSLVVPRGHALADRSEVSLHDLVDQALIVFEAGSTGRQHLLEAFHRAGLPSAVALQATTTALIVQMVEAELGIALLPLLPSGRVTHGREVVVIPVRDPPPPIHSGVFIRHEWEADPLLREFIDFVLADPV